MDSTLQSNRDQAALWNGSSGHAWVDAQVLLDDLFKPFEDLLVRRIAETSPRCILDIGCGTGATTLAAARAIGAHGRCIGVDISEPMIRTARERADRQCTAAQFICADAQEFPFEPAMYDMIISRFGVMFFDDAVKAFANLHRAMKNDGELFVIVWRSAAENAFMTTAERAAAPLLPGLPARKPDEPGQFAFADRHRIQQILTDSGWAQIDIQPATACCSFPAHDLTRYFTQLGPLGRVLRDVDAGVRTRVVETVRVAFAHYVRGDEVRFDAACWLVSARPTARR